MTTYRVNTLVLSRWDPLAYGTHKSNNNNTNVLCLSSSSYYCIVELPSCAACFNVEA
jgi:hypothetical protein